MSRVRTWSSILGGPVCTRTADHSLHVNLATKEGWRCNLDCQYCPFPRSERMPSWPRAGDVGAAVMNALHDCSDIESITVSGPGEPTLHPRFGSALSDVLAARRVRPEMPVRVVTNGERLLEPRIRRLVGFADERVVKIDAGGSRISRPANPVPREELSEALAELADFSVESVFVEGDQGNANASDVAAWIDLIVELSPQRVYVTTLAQASPVPELRRADPEVLEGIAARLRLRLDCPVTVIP